jgi:hypothetical protein
MSHRLTAKLAVVAAAFTLGCSPTTSPLDIVGTYSLKSVSGSPLPYQLPGAGPTRVHVLDDMIILTPSGTYSEVGHKLFTTGSSVSVATPVDAGNFRRRGDSVTMESLLIGTWTGTIKGSTLTLEQQGLTLVYEK